jgi:hypothetical protein
MEKLFKERLSQDSCTVNIKTKEILALKVTNEKAHNGRRMLTELVTMFWINMLQRLNQSLPMDLIIQTEILDILRRMRSRRE